MRSKTLRSLLCTFFCCFVFLSSEGQNLKFYFPGDGEKNNNSAIGDFCCTGETKTIYNNANSIIGYVYYYGFKGGHNISNTESIASGFSLLVSGVTDYNNPADRIKGKISFTSAELYPNSKKTLKVGELNYTATILSVQKYSDPKYYIMGSVKVKVDVNFPIALILNPAQSNTNSTNNPENNNTSTQDGEPVKKILENGNVEIDYVDGSKKIISDGGITLISSNGQRSIMEMETVAPFVPPGLPTVEVNRWLKYVNTSLLSLLTSKLKNDQTSIDNLTAGEANLNIYQIINRRFKFLQSLNSN